MRAKLISICSSVFILLMTIGMTAQAENLKDVEITDEFPWERCAISTGLATYCTASAGDCNQYLPLIVGRLWELDNEECDDCDESEKVEVRILGATQMVRGQPTRVMEEREWVDEGEGYVLTEVSRNFVNQCPDTQEVYYWGEEVCVAEGSDSAEVPHFTYDIPCEEGMVPGGGAWKVGENEPEEDEAEPGILFPGGAFLIGARYFQEVASNAQDWAENAEMGLSFDNPANGEFEDCVLVIDRNKLEDPKGKEADEKVYCPNIGIVQDEDLELTSCEDAGMMDCSQ